MGKTWLDIRRRTLNLGFEKAKAYDKNRQSYIDAYNWAQSFIASTQGVITASLTVEKESDDFPLVRDLRALSEENGAEFSALSQCGITDLATGQRIPAALVSDNRYLHLPANFKGSAVVHYLALPKDIDSLTEDSYESPLPSKWAAIMPYLMAARLYLDDDAGKAGYYWNLFDDMKDSILARENVPLATVTVTDEGGVY